MPGPSTNLAPGFRCRLCGANRYVQIKVKRSNGHWYSTPFFRCFGCSAMFTDPLDFAGLRPGGGYSGAELLRKGREARPEDAAIGPAPNPYTSPTQK